MAFSFPLDMAILISNFQKIPQQFSNYPSLKTLEEQNCGNMQNTLKIDDFCQTPVLGLGLGVDFTFANNNNNNNKNNPHLNFLKRNSARSTRG